MSDPTTDVRKYASHTGPTPCRFMIVGEAPGKDEIREGKCFVGKTGKELNNLLLKFMGIHRGSDYFEETVYATNLFGWQLDDKKNFTAEDMVEAYTEMDDEIESVDPDVILSLGALAKNYFLGEEWDMEATHAVPHEWQGRIVVPCYHPAATFHEPSRLQWVIEAFQITKEVLQGRVKAQKEAGPVNPVPFRDLKLHSVVAVDTETDEYVRPVMITVASGKGRDVGYIFLDGSASSKSDLQRLEEHLAATGVLTLMHNALFDLPVLKKVGIVPWKFICTMQMAFLLQTLPLGLKPLAYRLLGMRMGKYADVVPKGQTVLDIPKDKAIAYACDDAVATLGVYKEMCPMMYDGMLELLERDCGIMPYTVAMMERGMGIDIPFLKDLEAKLFLERAEIEEQIKEMVEEPELNIGSNKQLSELFYDKLQLGKGKRIKRTKWGGSVDEKHRKKIKDEHEVIPLINKHVEITTLLDKYLSVLPTLTWRDGRIHAQIQMANVKHSGRFAAKKPNLLAQPTRTAAGREIRNGYKAEEGYEYVSFDYSQIEMRIAAHESQDKVLMSTFRSGGDVHTNTAMRIFGISNASDVDEMKHRYPSKRVGFGILYGLTDKGLARELQADVGPEWTEDRCAELIEAWFDVHEGVWRYMNDVYTHARRYGYVQDMWGRRTYTPEVYSVFERTREEGLRKAGNCPIQAGAQGVIKIAMWRLWWETPYVQEVYRKGMWYPVLQIHDDLLWESWKDQTPASVRVVQNVMENAVKLSLPTPVDPKRGERWGTMVKWKS